MSRNLAPTLDALQHGPAPRPLPLFLELVRSAGIDDPELARKALLGLRIYQSSERQASQQGRPSVAQAGGARLRNCGGAGRPIVLVPSIINPPHVLDLDPKTSLAAALTPEGQVFLLDWGSAAQRSELDLSAHVRELLLPLLRTLPEPPLLIGYCLGGTMALAAAAEGRTAGVVTLASPWAFSAYPGEARAELMRLWQGALPAVERLRALPMELLQAAFWSLDPHRVVAKYARLAEPDCASEETGRFVLLEDWANSGEALPLPAARELIENLFGRDLTGRGEWLRGKLPNGPSLHFTAAGDRIVPAATAPEGRRIACPAGHVGMIVGRGAPDHLHRPLRDWLAGLPRGG